MFLSFTRPTQKKKKIAAVVYTQRQTLLADRTYPWDGYIKEFKEFMIVFL